MPRRRVKKTVKEAAASSPGPSVDDANQPQIAEKEQEKVKQVPLIDQEG